MSRHINLGNDINSSLRSIGYYFFDIIVSIIASIQRISFHNAYLIFRNQEIGIIFLFRTCHAGTVVLIKLTPSSFFGKQRVFLNLYTPALIVRQMPVEFIEFIQRHQIQYMLHLIFIPEMTGSIQHKSTPFKTGGIFYLHGRNRISLFFSLYFYRCRKQLANSSNRRNKARIVSCLYPNRLRCRLKFIRAGLSTGIFQLEIHIYLILIGSDFNRRRYDIPKNLLQIPDSRKQGLIGNPNLHSIF